MRTRLPDQAGFCDVIICMTKLTWDAHNRYSVLFQNLLRLFLPEYGIKLNGLGSTSNTLQMLGRLIAENGDCLSFDYFKPVKDEREAEKLVLSEKGYAPLASTSCCVAEHNSLCSIYSMCKSQYKFSKSEKGYAPLASTSCCVAEFYIIVYVQYIQCVKVNISFLSRGDPHFMLKCVVAQLSGWIMIVIFRICPPVKRFSIF
jgi:hypothetical protein